MFYESVDNEVRSHEGSPTVIIVIHMNIAPRVAFALFNQNSGCCAFVKTYICAKAKYYTFFPNRWTLL